MNLLLREVLTHPALAHAEPSLLSGEDQLDHPVRWVHTADLYDIAPLLRGDEVLLTNGVGLVSVDEAAQRTYVRRLAERSVAALFFEVGRTTPQIPEAMVDEARRLGLALVVLQPVLRFTEVAEAVNSEIIDRSVTRLRHADEISRTLSEALAQGAGVSALLDLIASTVRSRVALYDSADRLVDSAGAPDPAVGTRPVTEIPIMIEGTAWGRMTIGATSESDHLVQAVIDRAPRVIELCLIREQPKVTATFRVRQMLLEQLARGASVSGSAIEDKLRGTGMPVAGHDYICLVLHGESVPDAARIIDEVGRRCGQSIYGYIEGSLCALVAAPPDTAAARLSILAVKTLEELLHGRQRVCAAVSDATRAPGHLPHLMADTRLGLDLAVSMRSPGPVVRTRATSTERLLRHLDPETLRRFIADVLGPLHAFAADDDLLTTLQVFSQCLGSKTDAANQLHIRRQSLYYRLRKITEMLGIDLDDPRELAVLSTAFAARRVLELSDPAP
ncbi:PucR family transcriptional regulator [Streptomyces sp. NPDC056352]|uniref:PucR family transcriptional regulator n=1 Tax=Streptomyces sp. NPDC056352 TaxID=3345791 RepID=UPI0035D5DE90